MSGVNGSTHIQDGTAEGLFEFLDYVVAKGYGPATAVGPWRSAARQIITTVEKTDAIDGVKVLSLDLEDYLGRFETLARGSYKVESVQSYRRRFTLALEAYRAFVETGKPPAFRGSGSRPKADGAAPKPNAATPRRPAAPAPATAAAHSGGGSEDRMIDYPFPLRSGQVASLRLPVRFEKADAERLAAFIRTLVFEPMREITSGHEKESE